jgi:hypothetical protein
LIFALASRNPDKTIAVRAANEYSISKTNFTVIMNPQLTYINKLKGVGDMKFCHHYFPGIISDRINSTTGLANFKEASLICQNSYSLIHHRYSMIFKSDPHVYGFLTFFELGNYKIRCFIVKIVQKLSHKV